MKIVVAMVVLIAVLGGGGYGLYRAGMLPIKPAKKGVKAAAAQSAAAPTPVTDANLRPPSSRPRKTAPPAGRNGPTAEEVAENGRRMARLVSLYESMKPDEAQPVIEKLPDPLVLELLRRMDERQAGKLLLGMKVERAAKLTSLLAESPAEAVATRRQ